MRDGSVITLLTDFGTTDSYVAEVKGVLLTRAPGVVLVDVTHELRQGDIRAAQVIQGRVWRRFPAGTVHLCVVDPGVGTSRQALAVAAGGHLFVGPDNGVLTAPLEDGVPIALPIPASASPTFHGRDVFAPAAAALAAGASPRDLGPPARDTVRTPLPAPRHEPGGTVGEILLIDRFGNLLTNLPGTVAPTTRVLVAGTDVGPMRRTFGDVAPGSLVAYVGSGDTVEIAVRNGSAASRLGVAVGAEVRVTTA